MSSKNNLTSEQYIAAKTKWASGNYRLKDLAEEFGISITAFNRRFARDGIKKGQDRQKHEKAISEAVEGTMIANSQRPRPDSRPRLRRYLCPDQTPP